MDVLPFDFVKVEIFSKLDLATVSSLALTSKVLYFHFGDDIPRIHEFLELALEFNYPKLFYEAFGDGRYFGPKCRLSRDLISTIVHRAAISGQLEILKGLYRDCDMFIVRPLSLPIDVLSVEQLLCYKFIDSEM